MVLKTGVHLDILLIDQLARPRHFGVKGLSLFFGALFKKILLAVVRFCRDFSTIFSSIALAVGDWNTYSQSMG